MIIWGGGGENVRGKDMTALHQTAERFLSVMMLDGVFDRHPNLRGACVELGDRARRHAEMAPGPRSLKNKARMEHASNKISKTSSC